MTAAEIIRTASAAGLTLKAKGDLLSITPATRLPPDLRALLIANKVEVIAHLRRCANEPLSRCRAWRIRFVDGTGCTAIDTANSDSDEMLRTVRDQFGPERVAAAEPLR